jgi:hypothetical protein
VRLVSRKKPRMPVRAVRAATPGRVRRYEPGDRLYCLVLAPGPAEWAGVDVESGAIVRARPGGAAPAPPAVPGPAHGPQAASGTRPAGQPGGTGRPRRFGRKRRDAERAGQPGPGVVTALDLVEIVLAADGEPPDPGRPEAVALAAPPTLLGRLPARQSRRLIASLVARDNVRPLLGAVGPSVPYSDLDGIAPSIVVVEPTRGPEIVSVDGTVWSTFGLRGAHERLPLIEPRTVAVASVVPGTVLTRAGAASMLGFEPRYLVVALVPPVGGHARKTVIGVLPRP